MQIDNLKKFTAKTGIVLVVSVSLASGLLLWGQSPSPNPSASVAETIKIPVTAEENLTADEVKILKKEFSKAQRSYQKALEHSQKQDLVSLEAAQKAKWMEWNKIEKEKRRTLWKEKTSGAERRSFMKDQQSRRKALDSELKEDRAKYRKDQESKRAQCKADLDERLKSFEADLTKKIRPSEKLWFSELCQG